MPANFSFILYGWWSLQNVELTYMMSSRLCFKEVILAAISKMDLETLGLETKRSERRGLLYLMSRLINGWASTVVVLRKGDDDNKIIRICWLTCYRKWMTGMNPRWSLHPTPREFWQLVDDGAICQENELCHKHLWRFGLDTVPPSFPWKEV